MEKPNHKSLTHQHTKLTIFLIFTLTILTGIASADTVTVGYPGSGADYICDGLSDEIEINDALASVAGTGGTVYLEGPHTYIINDSVEIWDDTVLTGDSDAVIKVQHDAYFYEYYPLISSIGSVGNIVVHGFEVDGNYAENNEHEKGSGDYYTLMSFSEIDNIEVYDMYLHDSAYDLLKFDLCTNAVVHDITGRNQGYDFANFYRCDGVELSDSDISIAVGTSVSCEFTDNINIHDNEIYAENDTAGAGIYIFSSYMAYPVTSVEIANNVIHDTGNAGIYLTALSEDGSLDNKSQACNAYIHNNVIYSTGLDGSDLSGGIFTAGFNNTVIENNVIYDVEGNGITISHDQNAPDFTDVEYTIRNNIISSSSDYGIQNYETSTHIVTVEYNDIYDNNAGTYTGTGITYLNNIETDPLFYNPANSDFHLRSTSGRWNIDSWETDESDSPCIDAGNPASAYSNEPADNGGRINIGAYGNTVYASKSGEGGSGSSSVSGFSGTFETVYSGEDISDNTLDIPDGTYSFSLSMDNYIEGNGSVVTGDLSSYPESDAIELLLEFASSGDISDTSVNNFTVTSSGVTWVETEYGYKPYFDGVDDYMEVPDNSNLDFDNNFSLTMRYNMTSVDQYYSPLFSKMGYYNGYEVQHTRYDELLYRYGDDENELQTSWGSEDIVPLNEWHLITVTFNNGIITRMVDGEIVNVSDFSSEPIISDSSRDLSIFRNINNCLYTNGYIDMAVVHDTVLSLADHRALMNELSGTLVKPVEESQWTVYDGSPLSFEEDAYTALDIRSSGNGTANITLSGYADEDIEVYEVENGSDLAVYITHTPSASYTDGSIRYELSDSSYAYNINLVSNNENSTVSIDSGIITIDTGAVVSGTEYSYIVTLSDTE